MLPEIRYCKKNCAQKKLHRKCCQRFETYEKPNIESYVPPFLNNCTANASKEKLYNAIWQNIFYILSYFNGQPISEMRVNGL